MDLSANKIRNIMLCGHSGEGKTIFAEALLFAAKASDRQGTISDGNTVCDFDPEEIRRLASISLAVAPLDHKNCRINLLDAPGLFDFELGMYEGIKAVESVMIVISARSGVTVGAQKAFKLAAKNKKAISFYISKLDAEHVNFVGTFTAMKEAFGSSLCPIIVPIIAEGKPTVYVNLVEMTAFTYSGGKATAVAVPSDSVIEEMAAAMREAIAETDESLLEKFLEDEPFTKEELVKGLRHGAATGLLVPVICGSAAAQEAVDLALDAMVDILPAADGVCEALDKAGEPVELKCDAAGPMVAYVFKTVADPFVGKLSYVKVLSGKLSSEVSLVNAESGQQERMGKLLSIKGKKQTDIKELVAGDIGAVTKLSEVKTGDTLCGGAIYRIPRIEFPAPSMSMAVVSKKKGDESKVSTSMQRLLEEDPTVGYSINSETVQQVLSGLGEQHLDVIVSKLRTKFGVEVELVTPRVPYRETIRKKVRVQGRHKKQSGGHGQFGDVWIEFEPNPESEELVFEEKVFGGAVPRNFFPAVEKGLRDSVKHGVLAGYPVVNLKATLVDGSYHSVDSSEMAFKTAASLAYKAGLAQASPVLLEPIGALTAYVPDTNTGDIMGEVNKRRGRVLGMNPAGDGLQAVEAEVPMSEMHDFTTYIRSSTQGRGNFTFTFLRYEQLPSQFEAKVIEDAKELREKEDE